MAGGEVKEKDETLIGIDQRMINQKDPSQMEIEIMWAEMIKVNRDVSDVVKRGISKGTVWWKMFICTKRKKQTKTLI